MRTFRTQRDALDFIVGEISAEALRQNIPLSKIERKILYFSETDPTLPDMKSVDAEFDRDYDEDTYERKIAALLSRIISKNRDGNDEERANWDAAIAKASEGDYYLFVMFSMAVDLADGHSDFFVTGETPSRPPHDRLKLWLTAFMVVLILLGSMLLWTWLYSHSGPRFRSFSDWLFEDGMVRGLVSVVFFAFVILIARSKLGLDIFRRR